MKKGFIVLFVLVGVLVFTLMWVIGTSNHLVRLNENVSLKYGDIQTQLQRRNDLIPNLVATAKGYAEHEQQVFTEIANARENLAGAISSNDVAAMAQANEALTASLGRLIALVENYPELKSDVHFTALMDELSGTENRINYARQEYNLVVSEYNKAIRVFPSSIIAGMSGYTAKLYFEADDTASDVPIVEF